MPSILAGVTGDRGIDIGDMLEETLHGGQGDVVDFVEFTPASQTNQQRPPLPR